MARGRFISNDVIMKVIKRDECTCQKCGKVGEFIFRYGHPAVVENPNNRKLVAYITEDNTVERNITRKHKEEAQELGLIVE